MADDQERLEALEEFARRIVRLTNAGWVDEETAAALAVAANDPSRRGGMYRLVLLLADGRLRLVHAPQPPPQQSPTSEGTDLSTGLRRNAFLLETYEKEVGVAKSYSTVITGAGYAGLIAIWSGLSGKLDKLPLLWSGVLIIISLTTFVVFEAMKIRGMQENEAGLTRVVASYFYTDQFEVEVGKARAAEFERVGRVNRFQPLSFAISLSTGVGAAAIVLLNCLLVAAGLHLTFGIH